MKKKLFAVLLVAVLLSACSFGAQPEEQASPTVLQMANIQSGLAPDLPQALQTLPGNPSVSYYDRSLNQGHNFFYTSEWEVSQLSKLLQDALREDNWELLSEGGSENQVLLQFRQGARNLSLSISTKISSNYPKELALQGTLVSGIYDYELPPNP